MTQKLIKVKKKNEMEVITLIKWFTALHNNKNVKSINISLDADKNNIILTMRTILEKPKISFRKGDKKPTRGNKLSNLYNILKWSVKIREF